MIKTTITEDKDKLFSSETVIMNENPIYEKLIKLFKNYHDDGFSIVASTYTKEKLKKLNLEYALCLYIDISNSIHNELYEMFVTIEKNIHGEISYTIKGMTYGYIIHTKTIIKTKHMTVALLFKDYKEVVAKTIKGDTISNFIKQNPYNLINYYLDKYALIGKISLKLNSKMFNILKKELARYNPNGFAELYGIVHNTIKKEMNYDNAKDIFEIITKGYRSSIALNDIALNEQQENEKVSEVSNQES